MALTLVVRMRWLPAALLCGAVGLSRVFAAGPADGRLLLRADVAAGLVVDSTPLGHLSPGEIRILTLPQGRHRVVLVTDAGELRWADNVDLGEGQVARLVELAAAVAQHRADYAKIAAGNFEMGCVEADTHCAADERPRQQVTLSQPFWIMRTEVTVAAYKKVVEKLPQPPVFNADWARETYPIVNVTWSDAASYCARVGGRLPTEAEWEYAARAGHAGWTYVWGNTVKPVVDTRKQANVADQRAHGAFEVALGPWFENYDDGYVYAAPVFTFSPNEFELFDMAGNVREWCADWYGDYSGGAFDPKGPPGGATRVLRGGSWNTGESGTRVSTRFAAPPSASAADIGLRCVRDMALP
jgi:formylglycine-generating enzyme required for sulfatase activity